MLMGSWRDAIRRGYILFLLENVRLIRVAMGRLHMAHTP